MKAPECQSFTQKKERESWGAFFLVENIYFMTNLYKMDQKFDSVLFNYITYVFFCA